MSNTNNTTNGKCLHEGHRQRLKEKFLRGGVGELTDHELLELLLFFSIPRVNTNETAHRMLNELGSLQSVIYGSPDKLQTIDGVGASTSLLMQTIAAINKRIQRQKFSPKQRYLTLSSVGEFLVHHYNGVNHEQLCAMLFDSNMRLIDFSVLSHGSVNSAPFDARMLAKYALDKDATRVIIAHNHPAGQPLPSMADREITNRAEAALTAIGVHLIEHIIIGEIGYMPTMQTKMNIYRHTTGSSEFEDGFFKKFYNS